LPGLSEDRVALAEDAAVVALADDVDVVVEGEAVDLVVEHEDRVVDDRERPVAGDQRGAALRGLNVSGCAGWLSSRCTGYASP
jgi:hypothetical protein